VPTPADAIPAMNLHRPELLKQRSRSCARTGHRATHRFAERPAVGSSRT